MYIEEVSIRNFRILKNLSYRFEPRLYLLSGKNAQGKTTFLEAIRLLSTTQSFQTKLSRNLVSFGEDYFSLRGKLVLSGIPNQIHFKWGEKGKAAHVNQTALKALIDWVGHFKTVLMIPQDEQLTIGTPDLRRRFLDLQIGQQNPKYLGLLKSYNHALKQRNALLKSFKKDPNQINYWTETLIKAGSPIVKIRKQNIIQLEKLTQNYIQFLTDQEESFQIHYKTPIEGHDIQEIQDSFSDHLNHQIMREQQQGYTLIGPHRDDLVFKINHQSARHFASRGQLKSISIALKFAELELLQEAEESPPLLLLDDIFQELDNERKEKVAQLIPKDQQVFVTTSQTTEGKELFNKSHSPQLLELSKGQIHS